MAYLVETYEKDDSLYPKDPKSRARVNELLYFDACTLYQRFMDYYYPQVFFGTPPEPIREVRFQESLEFLETFLENNEWACGGNLTIADFALVGSVASFDVSCGVDLSKFPNILRWYENCQKNMLGYEFNQEGAEKFKVFFSRIKK
jgi:glutathione S-transferase